MFESVRSTEMARALAVKLSVLYGLGAMNTRLEKLIEEKQNLQTQIVQVQAMLYSIDYYISEELLIKAEGEDEPKE